MRKKVIRFSVLVLFPLFLLFSAVVIRHVYLATHYFEVEEVALDLSEKRNWSEKIKLLFFGVKMPKPKITQEPSFPFKEVFVQGEEKLSIWQSDLKGKQGTVVLFHGFGASKSSLIQEAQHFYAMNYALVCADFRGSGQSSGMETTIGYKEAADVKNIYDFVKRGDIGNQPIILFGKSMGAAAICRAVAVYGIHPEGIILECPFASLDDALENRIALLDMPKNPASDILLAYGSLVLNINGFKHNPEEYASEIDCPTLLHYGEKDNRVNRSEINRVYENLNSQKYLSVFENSGHASNLIHDEKAWVTSIKSFLNAVEAE